MPETVPLAAVAFRRVGKLHYYSAEELAVEVGSKVIAQTEHGPEYGEVKILRDVEGKSADAQSPYRLVRLATPDDSETAKHRQEAATESQQWCQNKAAALGLPMKIVEAEVAFDGQQVTFYFIAEARVDFRQLVKDASAHLRMRVFLHQVGTRDHAKALGGYGPCGRPLCCTTFLRDFAPVSMKMAKDQSLYLNPSKFSGVCGKLMCCLKFEHEVYVEANERLPVAGMTVSLPSGERGVISDVNIFRETVAVVVRTDDETRTVTARADEVTVARACGDCGSAGGGCGGNCATDSGTASCGTKAKTQYQPIALEIRRRASA